MTATRVCALSDLEDGEAFGIEIGGVPVCLVRRGDTVHAVGDRCSHADVTLSEGEVERETIECWLHGSRFSLLTGAATGLPATRPIPVYPVSVVDGDVLVDITTAATG